MNVDKKKLAANETTLSDPFHSFLPDEKGHEHGFY